MPPARLTEGMAIIHTGIVAGVAPGATLAGWIIDDYGASPAFLVALGAGAAAALVAQTLPRQPMVRGTSEPSRRRPSRPAPLGSPRGVAQLVGAGVAHAPSQVVHPSDTEGGRRGRRARRGPTGRP